MKQLCLGVVWIVVFSMTAFGGEKWPFESLKYRGGTIVGVVAPETDNWNLLSTDGTPSRPLKPGETLTFRRGETVKIFQHSAYIVMTPHFSSRSRGVTVAVTPYHEDGERGSRFIRCDK